MRFILKNSEVVPWLGAGASCILITMGLLHPAFSYIALLLCVFFIACCQEQDTLCILFMVLPFANIFKAGPGSQSFFTYIILFYILWHFIQRIKVPITIIEIIILSIYLLSVQLAFDSLKLLRYIKFVINFMFMYYAFEHYEERNTEKFFLFYIIGMLLTSIIKISGVFPNIVQFVAEKDMGFSTGRSLRFSGLYGDPNYYSVNLIISMCLVVILFHKGKIGVIATITLLAGFVWFAAMTGSKSALFMLALPAILLIYSNFKSKRYFLVSLFFLVAVSVVILIIDGKISIFNNTLERITKVAGVDDLTTGRSEIWREYAGFFSTNLNVLLLGAGIGAQLVGGHAAHNTYIDMLYYLGILGSAFSLIILAKIRNMLLETKQKNLLNYCVIITIMTMYVFLSQLFYFDLAFQIMLALIVLRMDMSKKEV